VFIALLEKLQHILKLGVVAWLFRICVKLPFVSSYINSEKEKNQQIFVEKYKKIRPNTITILPEFGMSKHEIESRIKNAE
jgi:hypothetical protein